ncbi:MAG: YbgA family protein [Nitrosopumilus sp. (ex Thoosa mismalolli)]|nr:YbgA family protein [Nitrosopumilus sp. (ex Thoosa mismalolli)]
MNEKQETLKENIPKLSEKEITDYVIERFEEVKKSNRIKNLVSFQAMNKYMIMAKDQSELKLLGNIVAKYKKGEMEEILKEYELHLHKALSKSPTTKTHSNVILHVFGHFSKYFSQNEKEVFFKLLEEFKENKITIGKTLAEINPIVYRFNNTYLASQTYFLLYSDPQPGNIFSFLAN